MSLLTNTDARLNPPNGVVGRQHAPHTPLALTCLPKVGPLALNGPATLRVRSEVRHLARPGTFHWFTPSASHLLPLPHNQWVITQYFHGSLTDHDSFPEIVCTKPVSHAAPHLIPMCERFSGWCGEPHGLCRAQECDVKPKGQAVHHTAF